EDQLVACSGVTDSAVRLACYDRLAREVAARARASSPAAPSPPPVAAPAPATVPAPATAVTPAPSFGQEQLAREQRAAPEKDELTLHARLSSQKSVGGGRFDLYLDNGQIWRHEDSVLGFDLRDGDAITIKKGALGSYKLSRDTGKWRDWIRVTR